MLPLYALYSSMGTLTMMFIPVLKDQSTEEFQLPEFYGSPFFYLALLGFLLSLLYWYLAKITFIQDWYFRILGIRVPRKVVLNSYRNELLT